MNNHFHQRGVITLLTLMLMAVITSLAVTASVLMVNELRQTETIGQGIVANYAAEAGMEDSLYTIATSRVTTGSTLVGTLTSLNTPGTGDLHDGKTWLRTANNETSYAVARLTRDQTATLDFYDPDTPSARSNLQSIIVQWTNNCSDNTISLETTMLEYPTGFAFTDVTPVVYKDVKACNYDSNQRACTFGGSKDFVFTSIAGHQIDPTKGYRFTFRELTPTNILQTCAIEDVHVVGYDNANPYAGNIVPIPAHLIIKSTGSFGVTKQAITASVPWKAPVTGLASFVLFSEENITK